MLNAVPPTGIIDAINGVTVGDYDCFAGCIVGRCDPRPSVTADALPDDGMRELIHAHFAKRFVRFEPRAVDSIWMKWYLNTLLPPFLLADILLTVKLPVSLDHVRFIISEDGRISAVVIGDDAEDTTSVDPFARFENLVFDHLAPLIEILTTHSGVTRRVYWSNVGNTFEAMLRRIELVSGLSPRLAQARQLLNEPCWPDGRSNPLFNAVHYVDELDGPERRRRICCLQYMLPDRRFCKACPVEEARTARPLGGAAR